MNIETQFVKVTTDFFKTNTSAKIQKSNYIKTKLIKFFSFYELCGELHFLLYGIQSF